MGDAWAIAMDHRAMTLGICAAAECSCDRPGTHVHVGTCMHRLVSPLTCQRPAPDPISARVSEAALGRLLLRARVEAQPRKATVQSLCVAQRAAVPLLAARDWVLDPVEWASQIPRPPTGATAGEGGKGLGLEGSGDIPDGVTSGTSCIGLIH
jgi:hypothetical protein